MPLLHTATMNKTHYIQTPDETGKKNTFPIIAQLVILLVILGGLFGGYMLQKTDSRTIIEATPSPVTTNQVVTPAKIEDVPLVAKAAYVWDVRGQRVLYSKNADEVLPLASVTKLMTALVAHELIAESSEASVSLNAVRQEGSNGLAAGEVFTMSNLNRLALITSSNDAAYELGASVGSLLGDQDPAAQFITGMNIRAKELGLHTLSFANTTGLDISSSQPGAVGTAREISFLMEYIITKYPDLLLPTTEPAARVYNESGAYHDIENTNPIATDIPNLLASKTGYTDLAGGNLTVAFDAGLNRPIVITVLGSTYNDRFTDVFALVAAAQKSVATTN